MIIKIVIVKTLTIDISLIINEQHNNKNNYQDNHINNKNNTSKKKINRRIKQNKQK